MLLLVLFLVLFALLFQKRQARYKQEKAALHAQYAQEILQAQIEVQNATLQQIGQELHDNIGQLLSVARINLNILEGMPHTEAVRGFIEQTNEVVNQSITDLRGLTKSLDGDFVKDFGLEQGLSYELLRIRKTGLYETALLIVGEQCPLGYEKEIVLFRVSQEALNNILKHSSATCITAELNYQPDLFRLRLVDDGIGFDMEQIQNSPLTGAGAGLRNMERRVGMIGGTFKITSVPDTSTCIQIDIPLYRDPAERPTPNWSPARTGLSPVN
ncbi:Histidine kinase-, DNA gyrase B-, and HSP90-like ATPase [Dyadobacter sp. SG02]|nr:Histidine kinase-, DNA gyrase B-, and HSP90-like ATPase [Dyadobacter sp. SG02]